jgi:hypothetical protein
VLLDRCLFTRALGLALLVCAGCQPAAPPATAASAAPAAPVEPPPPPLPALTPAEVELKQALEHEVGELVAIGPRNIAHSWNLATVTDHIALKLESYGYEVTRQGFMVGEELTQNLTVELPGGDRGNELVILGTQFDSVLESPGANAAATGAAALLVLAKRARELRFQRSVQLVWLSNEGDGQGSGKVGSRVFVQGLAGTSRPVFAAVALGSLGHYSLVPGSQRYPDELLYGSENRTRYGSFLALVSNAGSNDVLERARAALTGVTLPVETLILPDTAPLAADGVQARFWEAGLPAIELSDTGAFRDPPLEGASDTPDKLDFERLARVTAGLEPLLAALAGQ